MVAVHPGCDFGFAQSLVQSLRVIRHRHQDVAEVVVRQALPVQDIAHCRRGEPPLFLRQSKSDTVFVELDFGHANQRRAAQAGCPTIGTCTHPRGGLSGARAVVRSATHMRRWRMQADFDRHGVALTLTPAEFGFLFRSVNDRISSLPPDEVGSRLGLPYEDAVRFLDELLSAETASRAAGQHWLLPRDPA